MSGPTLLPYGGKAPRVHPSAFVAPTAVLVGDVEVGEEASIWYGAVLRADLAPIRIGARTSIQDNAVIHTVSQSAEGCVVGADVTVGHAAVLHNCRVEDGALVGMNATVLNFAVVGAGALVAAGSVVTERTVIPPRALAAGVPAKVRGQLDEAGVQGLARAAQQYVELARAYRALHEGVRDDG